MNGTTANRDILDRIFAVVESRRGGDPNKSYSARLFEKGRGKICQKLGEEVIETIVAALSETPAKVTEESADLLYHLLVLWAQTGVRPDDVWAALARREGVSGIAEKKSRSERQNGQDPAAAQDPGEETKLSLDPQQAKDCCVMAYDANNIFARILRGEISTQKVYEDEHVLAFHDANPQAPVHILVIPKGEYESMDDFSQNASDGEIAALMRAVGKIARDNGVAGSGFRFLANTGKDGGQEVPHFHIHIFGGRPLGPMLARTL